MPPDRTEPERMIFGSQIYDFAKPDRELGVAIERALDQCGYTYVIAMDAWVKAADKCP